MKLLGITEQEFTDKLTIAIKDGTNTSTSNDGEVILHQVRIDVRNTNESDDRDKQLELMVMDFIKEKAKALTLDKTDIELSIDYVRIRGVYTKWAVKKFLHEHNLKIDNISFKRNMLIEYETSVVMYKKGLTDAIKLMDIMIVVLLEFYKS